MYAKNIENKNKYEIFNLLNENWLVDRGAIN